GSWIGLCRYFKGPRMSNLVGRRDVVSSEDGEPRSSCPFEIPKHAGDVAWFLVPRRGTVSLVRHSDSELSSKGAIVSSSSNEGSQGSAGWDPLLAALAAAVGRGHQRQSRRSRHSRTRTPRPPTRPRRGPRRGRRRS